MMLYPWDVDLWGVLFIMVMESFFFEQLGGSCLFACIPLMFICKTTTTTKTLGYVIPDAPVLYLVVEIVLLTCVGHQWHHHWHHFVHMELLQGGFLFLCTLQWLTPLGSWIKWKMEGRCWCSDFWRGWSFLHLRSSPQIGSAAALSLRALEKAKP